MARRDGNRLIAERALPRDGVARAAKGVRLVRSVRVNLAESPLGWLKARGMVSERQYEAGEQLRRDWELAQLGPSVTMRWDASPVAKGAKGPAEADPTIAQISARKRFDTAVAAAGPGLADILWRIVCAGEGMREAEGALGWPARAGRLVLGMALDRVANHYRIK